MGSPSIPGQVPHWDLTTIYAGLDADDFRSAFDAWCSAVADLVVLFDERDIGAAPATLPADEETVRNVDVAIRALNAALHAEHLLHAYLHGYVATDSRNAAAQAWMSRLQIQSAALDKLLPRFTAWVSRLDLEAVEAVSDTAAAHAYPLARAKTQARHLMSPAEEDLAADLNVTGGQAWAKLYSNFSSQIMAPVEVAGEVRTLPITAIRNLAFDADRATRQRAYSAEIGAWDANALPIASALNSIKGQANTLNRRRGWTSPLDAALFDNAIDRDTLDAMLDTAREFFPHFQRYLKAKAALLGLDACAWYDLFAPVTTSEAAHTWSFPEAREFILDQFGSFSTGLHELAKRAFDESWIDAEPRDGKRGGAFCMWTGGDTSRILSNYQPAYGGVSTLAHELGHAYHNRCLAARTDLQRRTPKTLAETASTFNQLIVRNARCARPILRSSWRFSRPIFKILPRSSSTLQVACSLKPRSSSVAGRGSCRPPSSAPSWSRPRRRPTATGLEEMTPAIPTCGRSSRTTTAAPSITSPICLGCSSAWASTPGIARNPTASSSATNPCSHVQE